MFSRKKGEAEKEETTRDEFEVLLQKAQLLVEGDVKFPPRSPLCSALTALAEEVAEEPQDRGRQALRSSWNRTAKTSLDFAAASSARGRESEREAGERERGRSAKSTTAAVGQSKGNERARHFSEEEAMEGCCEEELPGSVSDGRRSAAVAATTSAADSEAERGFRPKMAPSGKERGQEHIVLVDWRAEKQFIEDALLERIREGRITVRPEA